MAKKRTFSILVNDVTDRPVVTIKDTFEIEPDKLHLFKEEYFALIDRYDTSIL